MKITADNIDTAYHLVELKHLRINVLDFLGNDATNLFEFWIPKEVVVREPKLVIPTRVRLYDTNLYEVHEYVEDTYIRKFIPYKQLRRRKGFNGCGSYPRVIAMELYECYGDDGHTCYEHCGFVFTTAETIALKMQVNKNKFCSPWQFGFWSK
jgi:hypothetical protein